MAAIQSEPCFRCYLFHGMRCYFHQQRLPHRIWAVATGINATKTRSTQVRLFRAHRPAADVGKLFGFLTPGDNRINTTNLHNAALTHVIDDNMPSDKKRAALPASKGSSAKKQRTDGAQKFYAVKSGRRPGVYMTYAECQAQTTGFKGAICKCLRVLRNQPIAPFASSQIVN